MYRLTVYFLTATILSGQLDVYLISRHTVYMCECVLNVWSGKHSLVAVDVGHPLGIAIVMATL